MQLQFRMRPTESLFDVDPPRMRKAMGCLPGIQELRIFDDRASDATFVTLVVTLSDSSLRTLQGLKSALLAVPRVRALVVDAKGNETAVAEVSPDDLVVFART